LQIMGWTNMTLAQVLATSVSELRM
jgi:hypothetical protein